MYIRLYYVIAILLLSIASSCSEQQPVLIADTPTIETAVVETPAADTAMVATADDESDEYRENLHTVASNLRKTHKAEKTVSKLSKCFFTPARIVTNWNPLLNNG